MKKVIAFLLVLALALGYIVFTHASVTANQEELTFFPVQEEGDPSVLDGLTLSLALTDWQHLQWYPRHTFGGDTVTEFVYSRKIISYRDCDGNNGFYLEIRSSNVLDLQVDYEDTKINSQFSSLLPHYLVSEDLGIEQFTFPANGYYPLLDNLEHINSEGIWFLPSSRQTIAGHNQHFPLGHGLYFVPWESVEDRICDGRTEVQPDVNGLQLCLPLAKNYGILDLVVTPDGKTAHLLTLVEGTYFLTTYDLDSDTIRSHLALCDQDPWLSSDSTIYPHFGDQLLLRIQGKMILTDAAGENILLTAPISDYGSFPLQYFNLETGDLYFDGETLFVTSIIQPANPIFAISAWSEGVHLYHGEYDCSLTQKEDFYLENHIRTIAVKLEENGRDITRYICSTGEED